MSIAGVGEITALTWVLEIGDPTRFSIISPGDQLLWTVQRPARIGGKGTTRSDLQEAQQAPADHADRSRQTCAALESSNWRHYTRKSWQEATATGQPWRWRASWLSIMLAVDRRGTRLSR